MNPNHVPVSTGGRTGRDGRVRNVPREKLSVCFRHEDPCEDALDQTERDQMKRRNRSWLEEVLRENASLDRPRNGVLGLENEDPSTKEALRNKAFCLRTTKIQSWNCVRGSFSGPPVRVEHVSVMGMCAVAVSMQLDGENGFRTDKACESYCSTH